MALSVALSSIIALIFVFALVSLFCSALTETVSNLLEKRARYLITGLRSMLDEEESTPPDDKAGAMPTADKMHEIVKRPDDTKEAALRVRATVDSAAAQPPGGSPTPFQGGDLTLALFGHPLIRSLQMRRIRPGNKTGRVRNPQYVPPELFTKALIDTLLPQPSSDRPTDDKDVLAALAKVVGSLGNFPASQSLLSLIQQASGSLQRFEQSVENWYDGQMGRVSGWYKRWSKVVLGMTGLLIAVIANIDALQLAHGLYVNEPVRQAVVAHATNATTCQTATDPAEQRRCVETQIAILDQGGLPIWYPEGCSVRQWSTVDNCWSWSPEQDASGWRFLLKLVGWGLTAFAVSFGAPFWFDMLSKLGSLRSSGPKPAT